jgi:hypothetical protein
LEDDNKHHKEMVLRIEKKYQQKQKPESVEDSGNGCLIWMILCGGALVFLGWAILGGLGIIIAVGIVAMFIVWIW